MTGESSFAPAASGVYLAPDDTPAARAAVEGARLAWRELNLGRVGNKREFLAACAKGLRFPRSFGGNWDALADCLKDLAADMVVNLRNCDALADAAPDDYAMALEVFQDAADFWRERGSAFVVLVDVEPEGVKMRRFRLRKENHQLVLEVGYKIPISVLVVVHTPDLQVLLIERADRPGFWQSVTGSQDEGETLVATAVRELKEETGLDATRYALTDWQKQNQYEIFHRWRGRYGPGVTHNTEHVFSLLVPEPLAVVLEPREHLTYEWLPWDEAAAKVFSWSNADAIRELPMRAGR